MLIKFFLIATGLLSFLFFLFPDNFEEVNPKDKDVLGVRKVNAMVNKSTVKTTLLAYCISEGYLPKKLNDLYDGYLRVDTKLDLDKIYYYEIRNEDSCEYDLKSLAS